MLGLLLLNVRHWLLCRDRILHILKSCHGNVVRIALLIGITTHSGVLTLSLSVIDGTLVDRPGLRRLRVKAGFRAVMRALDSSDPARQADCSDVIICIEFTHRPRMEL